MSENSMKKLIKKIYAYLNDGRKMVGYKIIERENKLTFRFCLSNDHIKLNKNDFTLLINEIEVKSLLKMNHVNAQKIIYKKIIDLISNEKEVITNAS